MRKYTIIPQEGDNLCVCSALQAIFKRHGVVYTQEQIASELTPSQYGFHIDDLVIVEFMRKNGFKYSYFYWNTTPFNEPDMLLRSMNENDGVIGVNYHAFILNRFEDPILELINPANCRVRTKSIYKLLEDMRKKGGVFGLIERLQ